MLAQTWLANARALMNDIEATQLPAIRRAAELMADSIAPTGGSPLPPCTPKV